MLNNIGTQTIETERLILRKYEMSDAQAMFKNWANSENVCRYVSWYPHGKIDVTKDRIAYWIDNYKNEHIYNWVIVLKETGEAIGSLEVMGLSINHENCELGYCLSEFYWNRGLMTEAVRAAILFLFEKVGMHRVKALHDIRNPASGKVMEKAGMKKEGTLREVRRGKDGAWMDLNTYAVLRGEWPEAKEIL